MIAPPFQRSSEVRAGLVVVAVHADADLVEQGAQQLFAVLVGGGGRRPHPGEVVAEGEDRLLLVRGQGFRARGLAASELVLGVGQLVQRGVPLGFQTPGDQPVVRVDGPVAALGGAGVVAGLLDLSAPLCERGVVAVLEVLRGGQAGLQRGGLPARPGTRRPRRCRSRRRRRAGAGCRGRRRAGRCRCSSSRGWLAPGRRSRRRACGRRSRRWPALAAARSLPGPRRCPAGAPAGGCWRRCGPGWPGRCPSR